MKLQINSWQAVSTWTWNASDDTCGICRQAFDGLVKQRFGFMLLSYRVSFVDRMVLSSLSFAHVLCRRCCPDCKFPGDDCPLREMALLPLLLSRHALSHNTYHI